MKRSKSFKKTHNKQQQTKAKPHKDEFSSIFDKIENRKTIIGVIIAALLLLSGIGGFFTDFFSPLVASVPISIQAQ